MHLVVPVVAVALLSLAPAARAAAPTLPVPQPAPEEARKAADDILAGPAYEEPPPSLLERILEWIGDRLAELELPVGGGPGAGSGGLANVVAWVVVAVLVGVVLFLFRLWWRSPRGRRRRREDDDALTLTEEETRRDADEWIADAERHEREGSWKLALRCRFRALVLELMERGVVRDLPGRTSGELRADVRRSSAGVAGAFAEASGLFDAAWYGDVATGPAENERFRRLATEILAVPRGGDLVGAGERPG